MRDNRSASLGHAMGFGGKHRMALSDGSLCQKTGNKKHTLPPYPADYYLLFKLTRVCNDLGEYYYELNDEESSEKVVYSGVDYD